MLNLRKQHQKPEDYAEDAAEPIMLNPKIINVLFKASMIESFGSGFERTFSACKDADVKYAYENTMTGFKFIFYRHCEQKDVYVMSKNEKAIYELLSDCDYMTNTELAAKIKKSEKTVYRAIKTLKENGYIERVGTDRKGYWKIINPI